MKPESHSINDVLARNATSFFIPPFQRAYAWGKPEIERYFSDIMRIIESDLDDTQRDKLEHFFGTIVIKGETVVLANKSVVVDGQQRLTTTLLFLIALRDIELDESKIKLKQDYITKKYLTNDDSDFEDKIKLKQVTKDWDTYRALVNKKEEVRGGIIKNAYQLFVKLINENKRTKPQIQFEHYIKAIQKINVVVINLDERPFKGEDPQVIFETLNSLGKPLTLSDLVRNFVLLNMESAKQSIVYEEIWHPEIEAVLNEYTSDFFRNYLQYKTISSIKVVNDNNTKELYQQFKDFVEEKFKNRHNEFIKDIVRYVKLYKWIITEKVTDQISNDVKKDKEIIELIRNIFHDIKAEAFKPFVLGLLEYHQYSVNGIFLDDENLISILKIVRTYLIRRRVLGLAQGENKTIVLLSSRIEELATDKVSMLDLLSNMFYKMRFPNDIEIKNALKTMNFYSELKQYSKFILGKIEENNTKVAVDFRDNRITIEHIMPQKLNKNWEVELGDNFENVYKTYLHNIGNLILTEFNSEIGNRPFTEKKEKLSASSLYFRLNVINKDIWNEDSIVEHQIKMITWFLDTFSLHDNYKEEKNWNEREKESISTTFSPLDEEAAEIAGGNRPSELYIAGNLIKVKYWQEVFVKFLNYIKNSQDFDFELIRDNQAILFSQNYDTILKWSELKSLIEINQDLTKRYKNFDGKRHDQVENLTDDMFFIHINISASDCINRIANIMNKFNMSENYVEIVLN